jgi:histidinol-phosphate aminotransferase
VDKADQIRAHFGVNNLSNLLAERVLDTPSFAAGLIAETIALRDELAARLRGRGLEVLPSATNFVAIRYATPDAAAAIQKVIAPLSS